MALTLHGNNGLGTTNGTAAAPSLAAPDSDTGFYFGTNLIHASTDGTERLRIDASGRIGIDYTPGSGDGPFNVDISGNNNIFHLGHGTNNDNYYTTGASGTQYFRTPTANQLVIKSDGNVAINSAGTATNLLDVRKDATSVKTHVGTINGQLGSMPNSSEYGISLVGGNGEFQLHKDGSGNYQLVLGTYQGSIDMPLVFRTDNRQERMRITKDGQVNIGGNYTQTFNALNVTGNIKSTTRFNVNDAVYLWQQNRMSLGNSFILESQQNTPFAILTQGVAQPIVFGTNSTEHMRIHSDGDITIGNDPAGSNSWWGDLVVANTTGAAITVGDTGSGERFTFAANGDCNIYSYRNDDNIRFNVTTGGTTSEALRITADGHVLFSGLQTKNDTRNAKGITIKSSSSGGGISFQNFGANGSKNWRIRPDDMVGWGTLEFSVSPTANSSTDWPDHADDVVLSLQPNKDVVVRNGNLGVGQSPNTKFNVTLAAQQADGTDDASDWGAGGIFQLDATGSAANGNEILFAGAHSGGVGQIASGIGFGRENTGNWGTYLSFKTHSTSTSNIDELNEAVRITSEGNILGKIIHGKLSLTSQTSGSGQNWSSYIQSPYGGITASAVTSYNDLLIGQNIRGHLACLDGSTTNSYYHWVTHGSMGYAGIEFKYGGLTRFYNWSGSTTANATFTPTVAIGIDNQGDHWGGENPDSTMWDATNQNGWYYRRAQGSFAIATKSSTGYSNIYLNKNTGAGTSDNRWLQFNWDTTTIGSITRNSNNTVNYGGGSDYRLKKDDVEITDGITRVKQLRPIKFKWKSTNTDDEGFFAHEAQSIVPYAVTGTKDQVITDEEVAAGTARDGKPAGTPIYQNIDYGQLTPILTAALKEAIAKIEVLEAKVAALEGS